jgi:MFS family permease
MISELVVALTKAYRVTQRRRPRHRYHLRMIRLLRERNYALLWSSATISALGNWLLVAALPYYVYATTGSTLASGAAIVSEVAPMIILPSIGGVFADRWDRKRVMFWSDWIRGGLLLPLLLVHSTSTVWIVFVVGFAGSTVAFFAGPFGAASIPQLVGEDNLPAANSGFVIGANVGRIAGPFAAGVLMASVGLSGVVIADIITFALSGWLVTLLVFPTQDYEEESAYIAAEETKARNGRNIREWRDGIMHIKENRLLAVLFVVTMCGGVGGGMFDPLTAPFVRHVLGASAQVYGSVVSIRGVGGLLGAVALGTLSRWFPPMVIIGGGALMVACLSLAIDILATVPATLVLVGIATFCGTASFVSRQTLFQSAVPSAYRGRVFGTFLSMIALSFVIGTSVGSLLATAIGIRPTMAIGAVVQIVPAVTLLAWLSIWQQAVTPQQREATSDDIAV